MSSAIGFLACVCSMPLILAGIGGLVVGMYYLCITAGASDTVAFTVAMCTVFVPIAFLIIWCFCGCPKPEPKLTVREPADAVEDPV
jgi:Na+/melibiose symporter-like transporter